MPNVLITGANRGLGLEFARQYANDGWEVIASCRNPEEAVDLQALGVRIEALDMEDFDAVAAFGAKLDAAPLDLLIANAGMSGPGGSAENVDAGGFLRTLAVNSVAPTLLAGSVVDHVAKAEGKMVAVSSQMGSIADNSSGGFLPYRTSKAALNAAWKTMAVDYRDRPVTVALLHPGWVQTDMGGPSAPVQPRDSVTGMRKVIAGLTRAQSGSFLNYKGEKLAW